MTKTPVPIVFLFKFSNEKSCMFFIFKKTFKRQKNKENFKERNKRKTIETFFFYKNKEKEEKQSSKNRFERKKLFNSFGLRLRGERERT